MAQTVLNLPNRVKHLSMALLVTDLLKNLLLDSPTVVTAEDFSHKSGSASGMEREALTKAYEILGKQGWSCTMIEDGCGFIVVRPS